MTELIRIHIDREPFDSPSPTTGAALYALGNVAAHRDLFREVGGDQEDELIPRDAPHVHLKRDEHFYSQKIIAVIVNAQKKEVVETKITFDEVVKLAYPIPPDGQNIMFTITYRKGPKDNPKGSLLEGQTVRIKNGMIFDVTPTDRS
ncbi:MAG TPA: multiubiquitin domain-containing protein [Rhizomicrobium sp.]